MIIATGIPGYNSYVSKPIGIYPYFGGKNKVNVTEVKIKIKI